MIRPCARNYHSYTHLILALGIVRAPTVWGFMTSKYSCTHNIGRTTNTSVFSPPPRAQDRARHLRDVRTECDLLPLARALRLHLAALFPASDPQPRSAVSAVHVIIGTVIHLGLGLNSLGSYMQHLLTSRSFVASSSPKINGLFFL